jgi:hypothetical protein
MATSFSALGANNVNACINDEKLEREKKLTVYLVQELSRRAKHYIF